jgi:hypothetical protein
VKGFAHNPRPLLFFKKKKKEEKKRGIKGKIPKICAIKRVGMPQPLIKTCRKLK